MAVTSSPPPQSTTETLTVNTTHTLSLLTKNSSLSPLPTTIPLPNLIPKTRFIVDGFKHSGDYSAAYFLSHFHSDHYSGLNPTWCNGLIFCSHITAKLLIHILKINPSFIHSLNLSEPVIIDGCEVVLIDANHCPGAVQFLFRVPVRDQTGKSRVERYVHTGDFRFCDGMRLDSRVCEFVGCDAVFLDTTYCNPKFVFPDQQESIDYVVSVIDKVGIEGSVGSILFLVATYVIGKEKILIEIAKRCKRKVCVDARKMSVLSVLGYGESGIFTEDESESDVHVVGWNVLGETWPYFRPNFMKMNEIMVEKRYTKVVGFVPTGWTYEMKRDKFSVRSKGPLEIHLVPYSEHSNYDELREYVKFLKPKRVIPTVGSDVEKLDSKHANKMQKYFAGLVDETANKQDFLMSFHRMPRETEEKLENNADVVSNKELEQEEEATSSELQNFNLQDPTVTNEEDMEELIQQLRDCLPIWATRTQMIDLISKFGGNIVEAVSNFYERETEFHEQVAHPVSDSTSQTTYNESASLPYSSPIMISPKTGMNLSQSKDHKLPSKLPLIKNSVSLRKRKKTVNNKINKKVRSCLNLEPNGSKQSTITRFFNKVRADVTKVDGGGTHIEQCPTDNTILPCNAAESYNEEINQFVQIINGNDTSRSFAATILESTKGDISKALNIYYGSASVHRQPFSKDCSSGDEIKMQERLKQVAGLSVHERSSEKLDANHVCLLPEKYSPREHACWSIGQPAPYIHLARTFELVEGEKGKIKITSMLCNMFRSLLAISPDDVLPAVYLCTNKIAADHENMELNIGGSMVTTALEEVCGTNRSKIKELYNSLGDLGDVAQLCRQKQKLLVPPSPLLIKDIFSVLRKISVQTGSGSTARKKSLIVNLMRSCREKEMKFLVRTLVRNLRIGAMMRTVLPALAHAVAMNTSSNDSSEMMSENLKDKLQCISAAAVEAYNMLPSLDLLVPSLMNKGIEFSSSTLSVIPGIPIKPMLARITNGIPQVMKMFQNKAFTCEYKYDGQRAQIHKIADESIHIFSRNGDETTSRFPDLVNIVMESCKPAAVTFILDAEVVAVDRKNGCKLMSFQELASRERGGKASFITADNIKVDICVFVFDVMFANGEQLMGSPLRQRRKYLKDLFFDEKSGYFEYAKETTVEADDALSTNETTLAKLNSFLDDAFRSSCEGIVVKTLDIDADYSPSKRTDTWLKVKQDYVEGMNDSLDLVPIGAWHGNGRKAGWYSPFLMACYNPDTEDFQSVCRVMSGFSDAFYTEMKSLFSEKILSQKPTYYQTAEQPDMWFSAELVWAIRGADFTVSPVHQAAIGLVHPSRGISIRFPRFIRSVSDRRPEECSTSGDIADMFHSQTRKMDISVKKYF